MQENMSQSIHFAKILWGGRGEHALCAKMSQNPQNYSRSIRKLKVGGWYINAQLLLYSGKFWIGANVCVLCMVHRGTQTLRRILQLKL